MNTAAIVFAKEPGTAKRRVEHLLGRPVATRLATVLLRDALDRAEASGLTHRFLYWAGDVKHPLVAEAQARNWVARPQVGSDLGERMAHAFGVVLESSSAAVLLGTDCPDLVGPTIRQAAVGLRRDGAVLVPAQDGGYVLIGLTKHALPCLAAIFSGIRWGQKDVAGITRERIRGCRLFLREFPPLWDLDDASDLLRLQTRHPFLAATTLHPET